MNPADMSPSAFRQAAAVVLGLAVCLGACASELRRVDALDARDRDLYLRCRVHVEARLCAETRHCSERALQLYQAEQQAARAEWLRGYGCPDHLVDGKGITQPAGRFESPATE